MPFDPDVPETNAELTSAMFRGQFQGLKALIDALPTVTGAAVDGVNTLPPGSAAAVTVQVVDGVLRFTFDIPQGEGGPPGTPGEVSQGELVSAISGTALNPSSVSPLGMFFSDPVTAGDLNAVAGKLDELISVLKRNP